MKQKTESEIRNETLEEAAKILDLEAGEFLNDGEIFHHCANRVRALKTNHETPAKT